MTISQAQIRKDARLNIAYENKIRTTAPLGKIGNITITAAGSPKARMPGLFERFSIFWKAVFRARTIKKSEDAAVNGHARANRLRVMKYTGELLGKLQIGFVEARTESGHNKVLLSIFKTAGKLSRILYKYGVNDGATAYRAFYDALAEIKKNPHDVDVVKDGLEYLMRERRSAMTNLPPAVRRVLHEIALVVGVNDEKMNGVLYYRKQDETYSYYLSGDSFIPLGKQLKEILLPPESEYNPDEGQS